MAHKYGKEESIEKYVSEKTCTICQCKRRVNKSYGFTSVTYIRSGIFFERSPECVDMEKENLKTID